MNKNIILKTLVGSQAHGLADKNSDYDYRGVFVESTSEILSLGYKYKANDWFEGKEDQTLYELGHFLHLATRCNPSILEVMKAPIIVMDYEGQFTTDVYGAELRYLFDSMWNPIDAFNAFVGYSNNQRKKLLDNKDNRGPKFACAYLRTLYNLESLLSTGNFTLDVTHNAKLYKRLKMIRNNKFKIGSVIDEAEQQIKKCKILRDKCKQKPNLKKINSFLLKIRKKFWK